MNKTSYQIRYSILYMVTLDENDMQINHDFIEIFGKLLINFSRNIFQSKSKWAKIKPTTMTIKNTQNVYEYGQQIINIQSQLNHFINMFKLYNDLFKKTNIKTDLHDDYMTFVKSTLVILCNDIINILPNLKHKLSHIISKYKKEDNVKSNKINYEALNLILNQN